MPTNPTVRFAAPSSRAVRPRNKPESEAQTLDAATAEGGAPVAANDEPVVAWTGRADQLPDDDQAAAMTALGEPIRRELVERLLDEPTSVGRLAEGFTVSRAAISQHLKVLLEAGVVGYEKRGPLNIYSVNTEPLLRLESYVRELSRRARQGGVRRSRWFEPA